MPSVVRVRWCYAEILGKWRTPISKVARCGHRLNPMAQAGVHNPILDEEFRQSSSSVSEENVKRQLSSDTAGWQAFSSPWGTVVRPIPGGVF